MNPSDLSKNPRRVFRLRFPANAMLQAVIGGQPYDVIEIAEYSIWINSDEIENTNGICTGVICWSDGRRSSFQGEMGRRQRVGRVIWNVKGIKTGDVIGEQRRLISTFPTTME